MGVALNEIATPAPSSPKPSVSALDYLSPIRATQPAWTVPTLWSRRAAFRRRAGSAAVLPDRNPLPIEAGPTSRRGASAGQSECCSESGTSAPRSRSKRRPGTTAAGLSRTLRTAYIGQALVSMSGSPSRCSQNQPYRAVDLWPWLGRLGVPRRASCPSYRCAAEAVRPHRRARGAASPVTPLLKDAAAIGRTTVR